MHAGDTNEDATTLALAALGWAVSDTGRAQRLLDLTGLTPADLRARAAEPAVLGAVLGFLEAHEPDLIACAEAIGVAPAALVAAHAKLESA
jgi:adenine/guanine phosphoribosyltransferase-like PRPP-binding protein